MIRNRSMAAVLSLSLAAPLAAPLALGSLVLAPTGVAATPKHCPPGHAKKGWCSPGDKHVERRDRDHDRVRYRRFDDYQRYGLRRPRDGYVYAVRNDELFLIDRATQEVIEGLGALKYLLSQ